MALSEEQIVDQITVDEYGNVSVRQATRILRDGERDESFAPRYHRHVLSPDDSLTGQDERVRRIAVEARKGARARPLVEEGAEPRTGRS